MVQFKTTGAKKQCCSGFLAITADRQKLSPYLVLKWKMAKEKFFPQGIMVSPGKWLDD
jgi:hypothetical protein